MKVVKSFLVGLRFSQIIATFLVVLPLFAQERNSDLGGQITDQLGAVVVGAKITLISQQDKKITTTNDSGNYSFRQISNGKYILQVEKTGFALYETNIEIYSSRNLDVILEIKLENQEVEVPSKQQPRTLRPTIIKTRWFFVNRIWMLCRMTRKR